MMMNIFSTFNSMNFIFMSYFFLNYFIIMIIIFSFNQLKFYKILIMIKVFMFNNMKSINNSNLYMNILINIFMILVILNLSNLISFSFCFNSQLNLFFFFSLILWLSCIIFSMKFFTKNFMIHLMPLGCPMNLSPLMVLIELVSILIRPLTISVRMSANMLAGHLLIHLLSNFSIFMYKLSSLSISLSFMFLMILNILEISVSIIQPYIFCMLMNMYICENNH